MELSVYHNLLLIGSNCDKIYVYDYEFVKLLSCIELENNVVLFCVFTSKNLLLFLIGRTNCFDDY